MIAQGNAGRGLWRRAAESPSAGVCLSRGWQPAAVPRPRAPLRTQASSFEARSQAPSSRPTASPPGSPAPQNPPPSSPNHPSASPPQALTRVTRVASLPHGIHSHSTSHTTTAPAANTAQQEDPTPEHQKTRPKKLRAIPPFWTLPPRRLAQRLFTRFDYLHLHAASGTLHLAYGIPRCLWIAYSTTILHEPVPPWDWELPLVALVYLVKDATAVPLTLKHRRGAMRSLFLVAGFIDIANWLVALYLCPAFSHLPDLPDGSARTVFALVATGAAVSAVNAAATTSGVVGDAKQHARALSSDAIAPRRRGLMPLSPPRRMVATSAVMPTRRLPAPGLSIFDSPTLHIFYAACQILPAYLLFVPAWGLALGGADARAWMTDALPTLQPLAYDAIFVSNLFGSAGIFAGTLQARLLITVRQTHIVLALQLALPLLFVAAQALTCDTQAYLQLFVPYWLTHPLPWTAGV
eukprot:jgi/Ulvmu1/72/UM001_0075.1